MGRGHPFRARPRTLVAMGRRPLPAAAAALAAGAIWVPLPAATAAHPLGNFTINHFAGITVAPKEIRLDVVLDMAEIPTFQERQHMDTDGDGGERTASHGD